MNTVPASHSIQTKQKCYKKTKIHEIKGALTSTHITQQVKWQERLGNLILRHKLSFLKIWLYYDIGAIYLNEYATLVENMKTLYLYKIGYTKFISPYADQSKKRVR